MQPRLLNLREVALFLHVSRSFVYLLIRRRKLVAIRLGAALRVHPADLESYIREKRLADGTPTPGNFQDAAPADDDGKRHPSFFLRPF